MLFLPSSCFNKKNTYIEVLQTRCINYIFFVNYTVHFISSPRFLFTQFGPGNSKSWTPTPQWLSAVWPFQVPDEKVPFNYQSWYPLGKSHCAFLARAFQCLYQESSFYGSHEKYQTLPKAELTSKRAFKGLPKGSQRACCKLWCRSTHIRRAQGCLGQKQHDESSRPRNEAACFSPRGVPGEEHICNYTWLFTLSKSELRKYSKEYKNNHMCMYFCFHLTNLAPT